MAPFLLNRYIFQRLLQVKLESHKSFKEALGLRVRVCTGGMTSLSVWSTGGAAECVSVKLSYAVAPWSIAPRMKSLQSSSHTNIFNIPAKDDSGNRRNTYTFIVTFRTSSIPKHIKIGYLHVPVELYIPNPLRCFSCQKFGHSKKKHVREERSVPSMDRLNMTAVLVALIQNVQTAQVITLPSVRKMSKMDLWEKSAVNKSGKEHFICWSSECCAGEKKSRPSLDATL